MKYERQTKSPKPSLTHTKYDGMKYEYMWFWTRVRIKITYECNT